MKNLSVLFSEEARTALKMNLGIVLHDEHNYSPDELEALYEQITENFPYAYDGDQPAQLGEVFEEIVDVFVKNHLVAFKR